MNHNEHLQPGDDERSIDLLVDGELDDAARRALLLKFENDPTGWRRCALAFLEAQSWGKEFRAFTMERPAPQAVEAPAPATPPATDAKSKPRESFWHTTWGNLLAVAASFTVAFGLGSWYRGDSRVQEASVSGGAAQSGRQQPIEVASDDPSLQKYLDDDGYLTLNLGGVAEGERSQVRVHMAPSLNEYDPADLEQPLTLPPEVLAEIQRSGHMLQQERRFVPILLEDGRRMIVPVDELRLVPVSRTFQ